MTTAHEPGTYERTTIDVSVPTWFQFQAGWGQPWSVPFIVHPCKIEIIGIVRICGYPA